MKGLKLETDATTGSKNTQSVVDRKGRILGWLSFVPDRPLSSFLDRLWPLTAGFLVLLAGIAGLLIVRHAQARRPSCGQRHARAQS